MLLDGRGRESVIRDGSIKKILKKKVFQEWHMVVMIIRVLVKLSHIVWLSIAVDIELSLSI